MELSKIKRVKELTSVREEIKAIFLAQGIKAEY